MPEPHRTVPRGENLRRAVRWLDGRQPLTPQVLAEAGLRFDLTPKEQAFLQQWFADGDRQQPDATPG